MSSNPQINPTAWSNVQSAETAAEELGNDKTTKKSGATSNNLAPQNVRTNTNLSTIGTRSERKYELKRGCGPRLKHGTDCRRGLK